MRATLSRLASAATPAASRAAERYLTPGAPTGLTGLFTSPSPRTQLLYLYHATLSSLNRSIPAHSAYRIATEALTRSRLRIVESVEPAGYGEWAERARALLAKHPELFKNLPRKRGEGHAATVLVRRDLDNQTFVTEHLWRVVGANVRALEASGIYSSQASEIAPAVTYSSLEELREREPQRIAELPKNERAEATEALRKFEEQLAQNHEGRNAALPESPPEESSTAESGIPDRFDEDQQARLEAEWPEEPKWTSQQIVEVEDRIGAGLIEEVIQVAEGELKLVREMSQSQPWEELEDKPAPGQWDYFVKDRLTGTPGGGTPT